MICERCWGIGLVAAISRNPPVVEWVPCPVCNGCGRGSCCEGHEGQPEPSQEGGA
jgi:hypothetical protein